MVAWVKFPGPIFLAAQTVEQVQVGIPAFRPYLGLQFSGPPPVKTDQPRLHTGGGGWLGGLTQFPFNTAAPKLYSGVSRD